MTLSNKTILITGGGNGLGRELVLHLLSKGNNVIAVDINEAALQQTHQLAAKYSNSLATIPLDITNKEAIDAAVIKSIKLFGSVDCIINNAGIIQPFTKISDTDISVMKRVIDINF